MKKSRGFNPSEPAVAFSRLGRYCPVRFPAKTDMLHNGSSFLELKSQIRLGSSPQLQRTGEPVARLPLFLTLSAGKGGSPANTAAHHLSSVAA